MLFKLNVILKKKIKFSKDFFILIQGILSYIEKKEALCY